MYLICAAGKYLFVYHKTTEAETLRSIGNGYKPYEWERERNPEVYQYLRGEIPPHYPVPTLIKRTYYGKHFDCLIDRVNGFVVEIPR